MQALKRAVCPPTETKVQGKYFFDRCFYKALGAFADHQYAYNTQKILDENPDLDPKDPDAPEWGKPFAYHFWNEPIYGYYSGTDEWVLRTSKQSKKAVLFS